MSVTMDERGYGRIRRMQPRVGLVMVVMIAMVGSRGRALAVDACPDANNCAQVSVTSATTPAGGGATVEVLFQQDPTPDAEPGGVDDIAALALTLGIPGSGGAVPLTLADCTLDADGLPNAVHLQPSNFKVVVENASCANGRTHCLCPEAGSGITPDDYINLVVYGPDPLPPPGTGVVIPTIPDGTLLRIDLKSAPAAAIGAIPLHIFNQVTDTAQTRPQFAALLSVGDTLAVDQTCAPVPGEPPCSNPQAVSQVITTDGSVTLTAPCPGDCNVNGKVEIDEVVLLVNIAFGRSLASSCPAGDVNRDDQILITEVIGAVDKALNGCGN